MLVSAGTLQLGNGGATGTLTGAITDNSVLAISHSNSFTLSRVISGTGQLQQIGTGTTIVSADNTFTGPTTISAGTLQLGNAGVTGSLGTSAVVDNSVLAVNHSDTFTLLGKVSGTGQFDQIGTGNTIFTANNTYSGGTTISAGTLQLGDGGTSGSVAGNITDNANLAFNRSDDITFNNVISGTGTVTKLGINTLTIATDQTYTGATTITAGTLQLGSGGTAGALGTGAVIDNSVLAVDRSNAIGLTGMISGTGQLIQLGTGTTTLSADNTYHRTHDDLWRNPPAGKWQRHRFGHRRHHRQRRSRGQPLQLQQLHPFKPRLGHRPASTSRSWHHHSHRR